MLEISKKIQDDDALFEANRNTDLSLDMFTTIGGIRGRQSGKDVYSTVLKFKDLQKFLDIFPAVQRNLSKNRIHSIKQYILSGLDDENKKMRFFSAMTVTCRGMMLYDDEKQKVAIDTRSKMSINDGQHRHQAIAESIQEIGGLLISNSRDEVKRRFYEKKLEELKEMIIPVIIFDGLTEDEEKQLFFDLNNLLKKPSQSANIRLSQTDLFAKMSRDLAEENRYLKHYGVEMEKTSIHKSNENTVLLTTLHSIVKGLLGVSEWIKTETNVLTQENYNDKKEELNTKIGKLFYALPNDIDVKGKYLIEKSFSLKGIVKFIYYAENELRLDEDTIHTIINLTNFNNDLTEWKEYGAIEGASGGIVFGGSNAGINAVYEKLLDTLKESGIIKFTEQTAIDF